MASVAFNPSEVCPACARRDEHFRLIRATFAALQLSHGFMILDQVTPVPRIELLKAMVFHSLGNNVPTARGPKF